MEKSTSSSRRKHINSDEDDSTNNHDVIDKSTIDDDDDVQPTTSKSSLDDSAIKPLVENVVLPPLQSEKSLEKNKSEPFRYFTPDCKGTDKKSDIMDREEEEEEDNYEAGRTYAEILAAADLQYASLEQSESDTD